MAVVKFIVPLKHTGLLLPAVGVVSELFTNTEVVPAALVQVPDVMVSE